MEIREATYRKMLAALKTAKKHLEPDLVEPGRTVFWTLVDAIKAAENDEICEDEGCPHFGTAHICRSPGSAHF